MSELTIYFNDPSGSFMTIGLPVPADDLSAQVNGWIEGVPSSQSPAHAETVGVTEGDWIGAQLAKGRKDLFDPRKGDLALTATAKAEMEEALGLDKRPVVDTAAVVRSGDAMSFVVGGKTMIVHRSQILYAVVQGAPAESPAGDEALSHLPPPPATPSTSPIPGWKDLASSMMRSHLAKRATPKSDDGASF